LPLERVHTDLYNSASFRIGDLPDSLHEILSKLGLPVVFERGREEWDLFEDLAT